MDLASYKAGNNFKTFVLVAALTGLLVAIGYLIGGTSGLIVFALALVLLNGLDAALHVATVGTDQNNIQNDSRAVRAPSRMPSAVRPTSAVAITA